MNAGLIFIALVIIIANFIVSFLFRWVHKNKYEVNDYVYIKTIGGLLLARIDGITWESSIPQLIGGPVYNVYYVDAEKHVHIPESAIFCKFKGERLVCPFCDTDKPKEKCRIYDARPNICKRFICSETRGHRFGCAKRMIVDMWDEFYS